MRRQGTGTSTEHCFPRGEAKGGDLVAEAVDNLNFGEGSYDLDDNQHADAKCVAKTPPNAFPDNALGLTVLTPATIAAPGINHGGHDSESQTWAMRLEPGS